MRAPRAPARPAAPTVPARPWGQRGPQLGAPPRPAAEHGRTHPARPPRPRRASPPRRAVAFQTNKEVEEAVWGRAKREGGQGAAQPGELPGPRGGGAAGTVIINLRQRASEGKRTATGGSRLPFRSLSRAKPEMVPMVTHRRTEPGPQAFAHGPGWVPTGTRAPHPPACGEARQPQGRAQGPCGCARALGHTLGRTHMHTLGTLVRSQPGLRLV